MRLLNDEEWTKHGRGFYLLNNKRIKHETKRSFLPRRCFLSGKFIWMKKCDVVATQQNYVFWCNSKEFIINELTQQRLRKELTHTTL